MRVKRSAANLSGCTPPTNRLVNAHGCSPRVDKATSCSISKKALQRDTELFCGFTFDDTVGRVRQYDKQWGWFCLHKDTSTLWRVCNNGVDITQNNLVPEACIQWHQTGRYVDTQTRRFGSVHGPPNHSVTQPSPPIRGPRHEQYINLGHRHHQEFIEG